MLFRVINLVKVTKSKNSLLLKTNLNLNSDKYKSITEGRIAAIICLYNKLVIDLLKYPIKITKIKEIILVIIKILAILKNCLSLIYNDLENEYSTEVKILNNDRNPYWKNVLVVSK